MTFIADRVFSGCTSLEAFYGTGNSYYTINDNRALIVDGGETLLAYAVANTETSYSIPEGVTSIGAYAFENCSSLTEITIPEGVTSIGNNAFSSCSGLTSIILPSTLTSIGLSAFNYCSSLTEITINGNISTLESYAFSGCRNLTKLTLGAKVTSIPSDLFTSHLTNLNEIVVEERSSLTAALPGYGKWVKDEGSETVKNFSGAGTYTRTDIQQP